MKTLFSILLAVICMTTAYANNVKLKGQFENTLNNPVEITVSVYDYELEEWVVIDHYKAKKRYSLKFIPVFDYKVTFKCCDRVKTLYHNGGDKGTFATNIVNVNFNWKTNCIMYQKDFAYEFKLTQEKDPILTAKL